MCTELHAMFININTILFKFFLRSKLEINTVVNVVDYYRILISN
jgi:hypothetical protein